jgi:hypothetical protein
MPAKTATTKVLLTVGGMGVAIHLLLLRCIVYWGYPPPADRSFVNNFFVNGALGLFGGLFYALFLKRPVAASLQARRISLSGLVKGGLWGILATFAAFQGLYLLAGCSLALKMRAGVPESHPFTNFVLAILEIETYGLLEMVYFIIPAFVTGMLATAAVPALFYPKPPSSASPPSSSTSPSKWRARH